MHHTIRLAAYSVLLILILSSLIYSINSNKQGAPSTETARTTSQSLPQTGTLLHLGESHVIKGVRFVFQQVNTAQDCFPPHCSQKMNAEAIVAIVVGGTTEIFRVTGSEPVLYTNFSLEIVDAGTTENLGDNLLLSVKEIQ